MQALDVKTLVLILFTLNTFGFLAYLYTRFTILRMPGIGLWGAGHFALALCFFCVLLNIESPRSFLLLIFVSALMATHVLWWSGSRLFFNRKPIQPLLVLLPALTVVVFSISVRLSVVLGWSENGELFQTGYVLLFLTCAFYQLAIAREFISYRKPRLMTCIAVGCAFALIGLLSILKALCAPESVPVMIITASGYSLVTFVISIFTQVFSMFGLVLIAAERLQIRLNKVAQSDPLTGLLNRRGFELLSQQTIKAHSSDRKLGAVMAFDLDHFKRVNDAYGHATGDEVLKAFANTLKENTRAVDLVARFGGEEFVVLCLDVNQEDAISTAQRIRESIAEHTMQSGCDEDFSITVSVGLVMIEEDNPDLHRYVDTADTALYNAKAGGRNKVVMAEYQSSSNAPQDCQLSNTAVGG